MARPEKKAKEKKASIESLRRRVESRVKQDVSESVTAGRESGDIVALHVAGKSVAVTKEEAHSFGEARTRKQKEAVLNMIAKRSRESQKSVAADIAKEAKAQGLPRGVKKSVPVLDPDLAAAIKAFKSSKY